MSIASEIAAQIEDLEETNAHLHDQIDNLQKEAEAAADEFGELEAEYDNFMAYAESVTPGIVLAYKAQKELTR
jgi:predicted  nucleic acid-binding Zn-ribbon protein